MATQDPLMVGYESLSADINKRPTDDKNQETATGVVSDKLPELSLDMSDKDIVVLTNKWEKSWKESSKKQEWEKQCEENENYWLGKHFDNPKADKNRPMVDNLIFESIETYLPQVTRRNPEPLVKLSASELDESGIADPTKLKYVEKVKNRLSDLADDNKIRLKLKGAARHWAIYLIGVIKFGWDLDKDIPIARVVRPKKVILDPDATINEDGYNGNRIGEYRKMEASKLLAIVEDAEAKKVINEKIEKETGTEIQFIEWWTPEYFCWKMGDKILLKKKNPHWNYDETKVENTVDDYGQPMENKSEKLGINHLPNPQMPYQFLTVFNLGDQPMDKTSLIGQNLANQDLINKRNRQIDKNADKMNGGAVVSLEKSGLSQSQAKNVVDAIRKGGAVLIPSGSAQEAVYFPPVPSLPADVFNNLADTRNRLRDIFGTKGSTPSGIESEKTVRGKIVNRTLDTDRIGGGVSEYLEQFADGIYNWFLQLLYVYDSGFQFVDGAIPPKVKISVKEGSLLPKDSIAIANQALELAGMNRISNIDLFKRLEYPNPEEMAANVWLETNAPELLYKDNPAVQEAIAMKQSAMQADAQSKMESESRKNDADLQKEIIKSELKGDGNRSIPSAVPQGNVV